MRMDKVANSGNDEFYTPMYAVTPLLKYIPMGSQVWCPFDTEDSLIVKAFQDHGCEVNYTHVSLGQNFFDIGYPDCEYVISNPPYSLKTEVLDKLFNMGVPFAMLLGVVGLFESEKRFSMFENNEFEIMWLNRRVAYFKDYSEQRPSINPPFSSVWLTSKILPKSNVFERIYKS